MVKISINKINKIKSINKISKKTGIRKLKKKISRSNKFEDIKARYQFIDT